MYKGMKIHSPEVNITVTIFTTVCSHQYLIIITISDNKQEEFFLTPIFKFEILGA